MTERNERQRRTFIYVDSAKERKRRVKDEKRNRTYYAKFQNYFKII